MENTAKNTLQHSAVSAVQEPRFKVPRIESPISFVIASVAVLLLAFPSISELLQFDRAAILQGEWWRLLTGHLAHFGLGHLFWDVLMFVALGSICERQLRTRFIACLIGSACLISIAVLMWSPEMQIYRGLSGIDTALFTMLAISLLQRKWNERDTLWIVVIVGLLAALVAKIAIEMSGATIFVDASASGFTPAPLAHVVGAILGGGMGAGEFFKKSDSKPM